jgi:thiamine-monophosphate kinase
MSKTRDRQSGEDRLIARHFKPLASHPGALGLTDDAAFIAPPPGCDVVLKTDAIVGGVHFFPADPPGQLARKALRVNLSDLAAKGARPLGFLLSLILPEDLSESWLSSFASGLQADAETYGCPLFGGDTDRTPGPLTISIAMFGAVPSGTMVRRAGASPGDRITVTGTIGDAALGVQLRRGAAWKLALDAREHLLSRYLLPQPRNALAEAVRAHASAAMDVSDGLVGDLTKLCAVSNVAATIDVTEVPLSQAAKAALTADPALIDTILTGGDDYEVLCAVPPAKTASFRAAAAAANVPLTEIGTIAEGEGVHVLDAHGKPMTFNRVSYSHF